MPTFRKGSWDSEPRVMNKVTVITTPTKVRITFVTKSHDVPKCGCSESDCVVRVLEAVFLTAVLLDQGV